MPKGVKKAKEVSEVPKGPPDTPEKTHPNEGGESEETPSQRAQRISREVIVRKAKAKADREKESLSKAAKVSEEYMKSEYAPVFLPFKDRSGSIGPCLVIGSREDYKRKPDGDLEIDPKTRETIPQYQILVWVFGGTSVPHQEVYDFDANKQEK